jgi:hypothetical protein
MQLQLYMASIMKPYILEQHDFYVAQTNKRVLAQFQDLEGEADRHAEDEYKRLLARPGDCRKFWGVSAKGGIFTSVL